MSSIAQTGSEARAVRVGGVTIGAGPAALIVGSSVAGADVRWISLRPHHGRPVGALLAAARAEWTGPLLVEPHSADDLPELARAAEGVVIEAVWTRDPSLVRAVARLGLPVIVRRGPATTPEEWLGVADRFAAEGNDAVVLCEDGEPFGGEHLAGERLNGGWTLDLALLRRARERSRRPVLAGLGDDAGLAAAAVAAGADGLLLGPQAPPAEVALAREAVTVLGALARRERPASIEEARGAIDRVDAALATLLERRAELAGTVQRLKPVGGFAGRDPDRERRLVAVMARRAPRLGEVRLARIMNEVIEAGLHLAEEERRDGGRPAPSGHPREVSRDTPHTGSSPERFGRRLDARTPGATEM